MNTIDKIRAEIERLIQNPRLDEEYNPAYQCGLRDLRAFLNTLSEEDALPCWEKVHTYTEELHEDDMEKMLLDLSIGKGKRETKVALPDKVVDTISEEPVSDDLKEAAIDFADYARKQPKDYAISAIADYDHGCIDGFKAGAEWQKAKIMKSAVEGEVIKTNKHTSVRYKSYYGTDRYFYGIADKQFKPGDKVRIIILPKEED